MIVNIEGIILTVILASCIISFGYYISYKDKIKHPPEIEDKAKENHGNIVGASNTKLGQYAGDTSQNRANNRRVIPSEKIDEVFYTKEEAKLDIDVDMEEIYPIDELEDEEDLYLFENNEPPLAFATGAGFDELAEMSEAIQGHLGDLSHSNVVKAGKTINTVESTDLFTQLVEQVENGDQKVADILNKCELKIKEANNTPSNTEVEGFDLEEWL